MATHHELTREELVARAQELAARLGRDTVARSEFMRETGVSEWQISKHFEGWNDLVQAAGLQPYTANRRLDDDEMFEAMRDAFVAAGGIVTRARFRKVSRITDWPYAKRWGRWSNALAMFADWLRENDPEFPYLDDLAAPPDRTSPSEDPAPSTPMRPRSAPVTHTRYGPFLNFRGLQHAPINEQGVVFLFGIVAFDLGYVVEGIGTGYPDCEAKRSVSRDGNEWERVRIEFEYRSRNFHQHGHDPSGCDVIVCWTHNWPECPIEVVELRSAIDALGGD